MENHAFSVSRDLLKKVQSVMLQEAKQNNDFFKKVAEEGAFYYNADGYYGDTEGKVDYGSSTEKVAKEIDKAINDVVEVTDINISSLIFFTPIELIEKCVLGDMLPYIGSGWYLNISEATSYGDRMSLFEEICPIFNGKYSWSKSKQVSKEVGNLSTVLDCPDYGIIVHLYMKGNNPVLEKIPHYNEYKDVKYNEYSPDEAERVTKVILKYFTNPVKEVYFVTEKEKPFSNVIARKNDDGELTLSIY